MSNKRKIVLKELTDLYNYSDDLLEIYVALDNKGLKMKQINLEDKNIYNDFSIITAFQQLRIDGTYKFILVIKK